MTGQAGLDVAPVFPRTAQDRGGAATGRPGHPKRAARRLPVALALCLVLGPAALALAPAQEQRAVAVQKNLRCPLCDTGESIAESRSDISVKMRESVREQIADGRSDSEIYTFFSQRYGNFVLLDPPKTGRNLLLWGGPLLALVGGGAALWAFLRRPGAAAVADTTHNAEPHDAYLDQVRRDTGGGRR